MESYRHLIRTQTRMLALGPRFRQELALQRRLLRLPGVAIWADFEFLGGLVIHSSRHASTNPEIKPYRYLETHTNKDASAWTEVSTRTCPPTERITAPGGRDLGEF